MKVVGTIDIRPDEHIKVSLKEFKGNEYVDMRIYFESDEDYIELPSKKGLTIKREFLPELITLLQKANDEEKI